MESQETNNRFPSLSAALANRFRDLHIPTAPATGPLSLKTKRRSPLPTCLLLVQAHSSMRICSERLGHYFSPFIRGSNPESQASNSIEVTFAASSILGSISISHPGDARARLHVTAVSTF